MTFELIKNKGRIQWTEEQKEYILDQYMNNGASMCKLGRDFSCDKDAIKKVLRDNDIHIKSKKELYMRDSSFFDKIDNSEKAYWLGFFYADGCVAASTAAHPDLVELSSKDLEHLDKFKKAIKATKNKISKTIIRDSNYYQFNIQDKQLHDSLISHGCVPQKSKILTNLPDIPKELFKDFLRGYFDGDGSLNYDKSRDVYRISFVSGSLSFLEDLRRVLKVDRLKISQNAAYTLSIVAREDVYRILSLMYEQTTEQIRLDRKYNLYQDYLIWYNEKEAHKT